MKKNFSVFGVLMLISSVVFAGGIDDPSTSKLAVSKSGDVVRVFCKSETRQVKLSIINEEGEVVFKEQIRNAKNGFIRPYNVAALKAGTYTIVLEDENGKREETIVVEKVKAELMSAIIRLADKRCAVTLRGKNEASAYVSVKDESGKIVFEDRYDVEGTATKVLNLADFSGKLTVRVTGADGALVSEKTIE